MLLAKERELQQVAKAELESVFELMAVKAAQVQSMVRGALPVNVDTVSVKAVKRATNALALLDDSLVILNDFSEILNSDGQN